MPTRAAPLASRKVALNDVLRTLVTSMTSWTISSPHWAEKA